VYALLVALHSDVRENTLEDKIKQLLRELGTAINESISGSDDVNRHMQKIRDEGYDLYVVLDATIGLNRQDGDEEPQPQPEPTAALVARSASSGKEAQFRINVNDLGLLRSLGIDPTRKVRSARRVEPLGQSRDDE
jgi:hypothetical protein